MIKRRSKRVDLESLMDKLASRDGMVRKDARESLVALGRRAVSSLDGALKDSGSKQLRWEAAKALGAIVDARSIQPLVNALTDRDPDVAWLAAEALAKFGKEAWPLLLRALIRSAPDSVQLRRGAHHVFVNQSAEGFEDLLDILTKDLESGKAAESAPIVADSILKRMKDKA
jgi:HEAT repeat protein